MHLTKSNSPKQKTELPSEKQQQRNKYRRHLHPGTQLTADWMISVGLFLRILPAYCLVAGLYLFTDNAFGFSTAKPLFLTLIAVVLLLHSVMCWNKTVNRIGWIVTAGAGLALFALAGMNPIAYLITLGRSFFNSAISYMMTIGYGVLYVFKLDSPLTAEEELYCARLCFAVLQVLISMTVAHCTARRLRVWPVAVITAVNYTVIFLYNISTSKWGFALSVVGICGLLCMAMADRYAAVPKHQTVTAAELDGDVLCPASEEAEAGEKETKEMEKVSLRGSAVVGFSAVLCSLLGLAAIALPAARVKNQWKTYDTIDTVMEIIRAYEMALITGEDMQIADLGLTGAAEILEARSSLAVPRSFTGREVLEIQSNVNLPVYLRSWVSTTFTDDKWYVANASERNNFKAVFSETFRAEDITYRFFRNLNEKLVRYKSKTSYVNHEEDGFMTTLISLKNLGVAGNILFLPSRMDSEVSLLQYGTIDTPYKKNWINYFDGIAYSRAFHKGAKYSAVTYLPLYKEQAWRQELNRKLQAYEAFMDVYQYVGNDIPVLLLQDDFTFDSAFSNLYSLDNLISYYLSLDASGQEQFMQEIKEVERYNDYVADSGLYTSLTDEEALNEKLHTLALEIIYSAPLPDTGLTVQRFTDGEMTDVDMTDLLAEAAMAYTVGDVIAAILGTADGTLYYRYALDDAVSLPEGQQLVYLYTGKESGTLIIDPTIEAQMNAEAERMWSAPIVEAVPIYGTDGSLIDTEYYVRNAKAFEAFLSGNANGMEYDMTPYYTIFAQRIAEYLSKNMVYTLNPAMPDTEDTTSSVERFLFVTKEGYCVQYATAATLLLRAVGIPSRYVEGYIAPEFSRNEDEDRVGTYICTVKDYNAHAWCEIYLENYGWLTTEVTTPYYSELYDPYEVLEYNYTPHEPSGGVFSTTTVEEEEAEETFWELYGEIITTLLILFAVSAVVVWLLVRFFQNRAAKLYRHQAMLEMACRRDREGNLLSEDGERKKMAFALYDNLRRTIAVFGLKPHTGETPAAFVCRIDVRFKVKSNVEGVGAAEAVYPCIAKNEFGDVVITAEELADFAAYIVRLEDVIRDEAGALRRFALKYLLGLM